MATYRDIINNVLVVLGEDPISPSEPTLTDSYHKLIGTFVNHIKEEMEGAHNWRVLQTFTDITLPAESSTVAIVGSNRRSRILEIHDSKFDRFIPLVFDITEPNSPIPLQELGLTELLYRSIQEPTNRSSGAPTYFALDSGSDPTIGMEVFPAPASERMIKVGLIVPQARLTDLDLDVDIRIPSRPLELGTLWYALEERGEELGTSTIFSEERYIKALDDAISRDAEAIGGYELVIT